MLVPSPLIVYLLHINYLNSPAIRIPRGAPCGKLHWPSIGLGCVCAMNN